MILTGIVRFIKQTVRLLKRARRPKLPHFDIPKPAAPKAPHINKHFLKTITASISQIPKISIAGILRPFKSFFKLLTAKRATPKNVRWYHLSPRKFALISLFVIVPELILQVTAFSIWLYPKMDKSPIILCVADYQTSYPGVVQQEIRRLNTGWKVVGEVNPSLTVSTAEKIISAYREKGRTSIVYLTLGQNSFRPLQNTSQVAWTDSFEWKWRTPLMGVFLSTGNIRPAIESQRFRFVENTKAGSLSRADWIREISGSANEKNPEGLKPDKEPQTTTSGDSSASAYDFPKLNDLLASKIPQQDRTFPGGAWGSDCIQFDFRKDGSLPAGHKPMTWSVQGNHLTLQGMEHPIDFWWRMENESLVLMNDFNPMVIVLKKINGNVQRTDIRDFFTIGRSWMKWNAGDQATAEQGLQRAAATCPNDPALNAIQSRLYFDSNREEEGRKKAATIRDSYNKTPDQTSAEALFFSMVLESDQKKAETASDLLTRYPYSIRLWATLGEYAHKAGNEVVSQKAYEHALGLLPDFLTRTRFLIMRNSGQRMRPGMGSRVQDRLLFAQTRSSSPANPSEADMALVFDRMRIKLEKQLEDILKNYSGDKSEIVFVPYPVMLPANRVMMDITRGRGNPMLRMESMRSVISKPGERSRKEMILENPENTEAIAQLVLNDFKKRYVNESAQKNPTKSPIH